MKPEQATLMSNAGTFRAPNLSWTMQAFETKKDQRLLAA